MELNEQYIERHILSALKEDVGGGDYSSSACIAPTEKGKAKLVAKQACVVCGTDIARKVFELTDKEIAFTPLMKDGQRAEKGDVLFRVEKRNALKTGYDQHSGSVQHLSDRSPIYQLSQILRFGRAAHLFVCQQT